MTRFQRCCVLLLLFVILLGIGCWYAHYTSEIPPPQPDTANEVPPSLQPPDGGEVPAGSADIGTAHPQEIETDQAQFPEPDVLTPQLGHTRDVASAVWSPDEKYVLTGSDDNTARIWKNETAQELCVLNGHTDYILSVAWSPD
ncbi:hypothetical protein LJC47_00625, partial [Desulfosarcina sp. OttesenSCG-928-B08]|nr:hypothetical protein [Desulfosarcina sp. OttesenSCG-928-B08]